MRPSTLATSATKLSITKPVTELPTLRQVATGSFVCTGVAPMWKLDHVYFVFDMPSVENMSGTVAERNIAISASTNMLVIGVGMPGGIAPDIIGLLDSAIDCDRHSIATPVTAPLASTPPCADTA